MRTLIVTTSGDFHSAAVQWGLHSLGVDVHCWVMSDFPLRQRCSVCIGQDGTVTFSSNSTDHVVEGTNDVLWIRRTPRSDLPSISHAGDREVVQREVDSFNAGVMAVLSRNSFCINPIQSQWKARNKLYQLVEAVHCGLSVPQTLSSTSALQVLEFTRHHRAAIFKQYLPAVWESENSYFASTATVDESSIRLNKRSVRMSPGIFQPLIEKKFELRLVAMGRTMFAFRLDSQAIKAASVDWRLFAGQIPTELVNIPAELEQQCFLLMERLEIVFATFDFIVTPDGDFVFLEINEMGQFLWLEEMVPDATLLDCFCRFVESRSPHFVYEAGRTPLTLAAFCESGAHRRFCEQPVATSRIRVPE